MTTPNMSLTLKHTVHVEDANDSLSRGATISSKVEAPNTSFCQMYSILHLGQKYSLKVHTQIRPREKAKLSTVNNVFHIPCEMGQGN